MTRSATTCGRKTRSSNQRGYVLFSFAATCIVLIGFGGLVFDVGTLKYYKRRSQSAADAGALGAAQDIYLYGNSSNNTLAAQNDITANGFTNSVNGAQVTVNIPPASGPHAGNSKYAEVYVSRTMPATLIQALGFPTMSVKSRAVGGPGMTSACVYVLDPSATNALSLSGNSTIALTCAIIVNSSAASAASLSGSACFSATSFASVGGYSVTSNCSSNVATVTTGITAVADPLSSLPAPSVGACDFTNFKTTAGGSLSPGVYCGGIDLKGGSLTMSPGVYILNGGGLSVGFGTTITGTGVTIYNTTTSNTGNLKYSPITINGSSTINLTAPTSGTYEGILFFTDRAMTSTSANTILGNSSSTIQGTIYVPTVPLQFTGNSSLVAYTSIVVGTLSITGNATLRDDYSSLQNGAPLKGGGAVVE